MEGLIKKTWRRKRETNHSNLIGASDNAFLEEWNLYYNGSENYWIINELSPSMKYIFRVKAKNLFGWSDFSETSKSFDFTEAAMLADQEELGLVLGTTLPALLFCCIVVIVIFCCGNYSRVFLIYKKNFESTLIVIFFFLKFRKCVKKKKKNFK